jgi:hypothetical protein
MELQRQTEIEIAALTVERILSHHVLCSLFCVCLNGRDTSALREGTQQQPAGNDLYESRRCLRDVFDAASHLAWPEACSSYDDPSFAVLAWSADLLLAEARSLSS